MRKVILLPVLGLAVACTNPNKADSAECDVVSGTITNADYEFKSGNFSCDTNPIDNPFDLNSGSFNTNAGLATTDVIADFDVATDVWSEAGADLTLTDGSTSSTGMVVDDDGNHYTFMVDGYDPNDDGTDQLATTYTWSVDGVTSDCDIRCYTDRRDSTSFNWVANATVTTGQHDLTYSLVHELGHCTGIADQTAASTASDIMFGGYAPGTEFPGLSADEIEAVIFLYGGA